MMMMMLWRINGKPYGKKNYYRWKIIFKMGIKPNKQEQQEMKLPNVNGIKCNNRKLTQIKNEREKIL